MLMSEETREMVKEHGPVLRELALQGHKGALAALEALLRSDATAVAVETIIAHYEQQKAVR